MGLRRKLTARVELILPFDDAVKGGYTEYLDDFDKGKLTLDGEPTVFHIEPVTYEQKMLIERETSLREKKLMAVRCALRDVTNYAYDGQSGSEMLPRPTTQAIDPWGNLIDDAWMKKADLPDHVLDMVSAVARRISDLSPL